MTYNVFGGTLNLAQFNSIQLVSSSLATLHMPISPWTTVEPLGPVRSSCRGTEIADLADCVIPGSGQVNLTSLQSTLVRQLPVIERRINKHGACS